MGGGFLCSVFEGGEAIGRKEVIFLAGGVGGADAFMEEVTVPVDNCVLKVVEHGRFGGEAVLPEVVLKFLDAILARRKGFVDIDGRVVVFDKQKDIAYTLWDMFEDLWSDDGFPGKRLFCSAGKLSCHLFCHFCHILPFLYGAECSCNLNGTIFAHSFIFEWGKFDTIH